MFNESGTRRTNLTILGVVLLLTQTSSIGESSSLNRQAMIAAAYDGRLRGLQLPLERSDACPGGKMSLVLTTVKIAAHARFGVFWSRCPSPLESNSREQPVT